MPVNRAWVFRCDICEAFTMSFSATKSKATEAARKAGWKMKGALVHCPECSIARGEAQDVRP